MTETLKAAFGLKTAPSYYCLEASDIPDDEYTHTVPRETWLYQLRGGARLAVDGAAAVELADGACAVVPAGAEFRVERPAGTIGMEVCNDRYGNKPGYLDLE